MASPKDQKNETGSNTDTRIIKKYPNRRLYDTERRSYITLNDIRQYVLDQLSFRVIDAQTEADLTKATLFQVITEHETAASTFFTTELLQQMIRLYNENMQNVFSRYFEEAMAQFIKQKDQATAANTEPLNAFTAMQEFTRLQGEFWQNLLAKNEKK